MNNARAYAPTSGTAGHAFTLLEVLLALSLLVILSALISGWLLQAQRDVGEQQQRLQQQRGLTQAITLLRHELLQQVDGPQTLPTLGGFAGDTSAGTAEQARELRLRSTFRLGADPRSERQDSLQDIRYTIADGVLYRQCNQAAARMVCAAPDAYFQQEDGAVFLITAAQQRFLLTPVLP